MGGLEQASIRQASVYFKQKYEHFLRLKKEWMRSKNKAETGQIKLYILKDTVKDNIAGYCIASITNGMGAIDSIFIDNDFRKKGYRGKIDG